MRFWEVCFPERMLPFFHVCSASNDRNRDARCYPSVLQFPLLLCCRALKLCGSGGPPHAKLVIEWENKTKEWWVFLPSYPDTCTSLQTSRCFLPEHQLFLQFVPQCRKHDLYPKLTVCLAAASLAASRKRWWKMQRAWGISSSSICSSIAAPWTSASSCTPKKSRWEPWKGSARSSGSPQRVGDFQTAALRLGGLIWPWLRVWMMCVCVCVLSRFSYCLSSKIHDSKEWQVAVYQKKKKKKQNIRCERMMCLNGCSGMFMVGGLGFNKLLNE